MINDNFTAQKGNFTAQKGNFTAQGTFVTLYKSVSYKAKKNPYIILYYPIRIKYRKRKRKRLGAFFFLFPKTSPKRNDLSPALNLTTWRQTATKQQAGRGDQGERAAKAQASALETDTETEYFTRLKQENLF
jgi:hypothetical protein